MGYLERMAPREDEHNEHKEYFTFLWLATSKNGDHKMVYKMIIMK